MLVYMAFTDWSVLLILLLLTLTGTVLKFRNPSFKMCSSISKFFRLLCTLTRLSWQLCINLCRPFVQSCREMQQHYETLYEPQFYTCQWQKSDKVLLEYLLYRIAMGFSSFSILCHSMKYDIYDTKAEKFIFQNESVIAKGLKWIVWPCHWVQLTIFVQFSLSAFFCISKYITISLDITFVHRVKLHHRIYLVLHSLSAVGSLIIILLNTIRPNPSDHIDANKAMEVPFLVGFIFMMVDLIISRHPMLLKQLMWFLAIIYGFVTITFMFYLINIPEIINPLYIHPHLDWRLPTKTLLWIICTTLWTWFSFFLLYFMVAMRRFIAAIYNFNSVEQRRPEIFVLSNL